MPDVAFAFCATQRDSNYEQGKALIRKIGGAVDTARMLLLCICIAMAAASPAIAQDYVIDTLAGDGSFGYAGDGGLATAASLSHSYGSAIDAAGNVYFADYDSHRVRRVDAATGIITTVAGNGIYGYNGDGISAISARLANPGAVAVDAAGNLYIAEWQGYRIRRVDAATRLIHTIAGTGIQGNSGNGGPATAARLSFAYGVAVDGSGNIYFSDYAASTVRRVDAATGIVSEATPATQPRQIAVNPAGDLYVAETGAARILRVEGGNGGVTVAAGGGSNDGEYVPATEATLRFPTGIAVDTAGSLFIADPAAVRVRRVDAQSGLIHTIAGTGRRGYSGDGGRALSAMLHDPYAVSVGSDHRVYVSDTLNFRIRVLTPAISDLSMDVTAADPQVAAGTTLGYGVAVANAGPDAADFAGVGFALDTEVADMAVAAPMGWTCDTPSVGGGTSTIACTTATLAHAGSAQFMVTATAPATAAGGAVVLTAAATSQTEDPVAGNNSDSDAIAVAASADLSVSINGPTTFVRNTMTSYTATVRNTGPSPATQPVVVLVADVPFANAAVMAPAGWQCVRQAARDLRMSCTLDSGTLELDAQVSFVLTVSNTGKLFPPRFTVRAGISSIVDDPQASNDADGLTVRMIRGL